MRLLVGTSGWSYDSWVGRFYPESYRENRRDWLEYYTRFFSTVEVASTSFQIPPRKVVDSWIRKTSTLDSFEFSLVIPHNISHHLLGAGKMDRIRKGLNQFEEEVMAPLYLNDRLGMVLLELSPFFEYSKKTLHRLVEVLEFFKYLSYNYGVEFLDKSWLNSNHDGLRDNVRYHLKERGIALCMVDGENFPFIPDTHSEELCLKLYGRNKLAWKKAKQHHVPSSELFDYRYSESELEGIATRLERYQGKRLRAYFKNHEGAQAVEDARSLERLFGLEDKDGHHQQEGIESDSDEVLELEGQDELPQRSSRERQTHFEDFQ